jgi:hypothetical protein
MTCYENRQVTGYGLQVTETTFVAKLSPTTCHLQPQAAGGRA